MKYINEAKSFFKDCINQKISPKDIQIKNIVFTKLKLDVLENMMSINKLAKCIGTYNDNKSLLKIEKVVGNVHCSLGFSNIIHNDKKIKYYFPKTLLQEDVRTNVIEQNKIIAVLSKDYKQKLYNEITYFSNDITLLEVFNNKNIKKIIDIQNMDSKNPQYKLKREYRIFCVK